ncbi:hypothetical protein PFLCHA0_c53590 [Pseudomonas protegens CHA0]|uniref:Uncharacterized protein n=1 Tax=Pseudomonas protegens (strain DSM 19095 / LMG 27888 / CFBP 6595 / CHA0) TaxID=1124983 RepID=A0A2C9ETV0_PSEPH|nr:hypothetical protein PFLCHA0_c53590 [Pseudomonas protegens CHA0]
MGHPFSDWRAGARRNSRARDQPSAGAWQPGNLRVDRLGRRVAAADAGQVSAIGSAAAQGCSAAYSRVPVEAVGGISQRDVQQ